MIKIYQFVLFMLISSQILANCNLRDSNQIESKIDQLRQKLNQLNKLVLSQQTQIDSLKAREKSQDNAIQSINNQMNVKTTLTQVQSYFQNNGIKLGNRWLIKEEGTGTYEALVFRDLITTGDRRYAMFQNKNVDL